MPDTINKLEFHRGTVFFNFEKVGWSENIDLVASDDAAALALTRHYVNHRLWTLPNTVTCVYGRIVRIPQERYSVPVADLNLVGKAETLTTPEASNLNDAFVSPCFRFIAEEGKTSTRFFKGVPDAIVVGLKLTVTPPAGSWVDLVGAPGDGTANPGTYADALKALISFMAVQTSLASRRQLLDIGGIEQEGYRLRKYTGAISRDARKRATGRPFGLFRGRVAVR